MYGKIFASMFKGSLYGQWEAIVTFTVMIVLADQHGEVDMTAEALSAQTSIPLDIIQRGICQLEAPDPKSRTPDDEGRRIVRVSDARDWGWVITNYAHYRAIRTAEERREYFKQHKRKQRSKKGGSPPLSTESPQSPPIAVSSKQEAEGTTTTTLATQFGDPDQRTAYLQLRGASRVAAGFDATIRALVQPPSGGLAYSWPIVGRAVQELYAANGATPVTAATLRAFCRRVTTDDAKNPAAGKTKLQTMLEAEYGANPS